MHKELLHSLKSLKNMRDDLDNVGHYYPEGIDQMDPLTKHLYDHMLNSIDEFFTHFDQ